MVYRPIARLAVLLGVAVACTACHGPIPSQRFGLKPVTNRGPYRSRLAAYKLRGEARPQSSPASGAAAIADARTKQRPSRGVGKQGRSRRAKPTRRGARGHVNLRGSDLEPVHRWFSSANSQFILADEVDIVVSKEFFSRVLTMNAQVGLIHKSTKNIGEDEITTLRYVGKGVPSAMHSPRVFISGRVRGLAPEAGFTVTARKRITVRMSKTVRPDQPVRVQVVAKGDAARGRQDDVLQRDDVLAIRGALRWNAQERRWVWRCG